MTELGLDVQTTMVRSKAFWNLQALMCTQHFLLLNDSVIQRFNLFQVISFQYDGASLMSHLILSLAFDIRGSHILNKVLEVPLEVSHPNIAPILHLQSKEISSQGNFGI